MAICFYLTERIRNKNESASGFFCLSFFLALESSSDNLFHFLDVHIYILPLFVVFRKNKGYDVQEFSFSDAPLKVSVVSTEVAQRC